MTGSGTGTAAGTFARTHLLEDEGFARLAGRRSGYQVNGPPREARLEAVAVAGRRPAADAGQRVRLRLRPLGAHVEGPAERALQRREVHHSGRAAAPGRRGLLQVAARGEADAVARVPRREARPASTRAR